jgi:hypothetical protein
MTRYLTKLCDQLVCLLSSGHSQAIVWGDEVDDLEDAASIDSDRDINSDRLCNYPVAKTTEQGENVVARQGFTVLYLIIHSLLMLTSIVACRKMTFFPSCQPALTFEYAHGPKYFFSKVTLRGNHAGFHDCPFPAGELDCREVFSRPSERLPNSSPIVSVFWSAKRRLGLTCIAAKMMLYCVSLRLSTTRLSRH